MIRASASITQPLRWPAFIDLNTHSEGSTLAIAFALFTLASPTLQYPSHYQERDEPTNNIEQSLTHRVHPPGHGLTDQTSIIRTRWRAQSCRASSTNMLGLLISQAGHRCGGSSSYACPSRPIQRPGPRARRRASISSNCSSPPTANPAVATKKCTPGTRRPRRRRSPKVQWAK